MPLQNRVTPFGKIVFSESRGTLMGNRGCLHDRHRTLGRRRWTTRSWVACALAFRGRERKPLMKPGRYTELFFLDEATALAAGHRPCATCRRADYHRFGEAWAVARGRPGERPSPTELDAAIHAARVDRRRDKVTFNMPLEALPDGTMIALGTAAFLKWNSMLRPWSFDGYGATVPASIGTAVSVLTPRPIVEAIRCGYQPTLHWTA
jgi:hypothetical protein